MFSVIHEIINLVFGLCAVPGLPAYVLCRACPVWVHFHARLLFRVTDRIVLLRVRPTAPSRRPFDPPSPGYFLFSGIRISFSSLPSLFFRVEPDAQLALASARSFALARGRRAITQRLCVRSEEHTSELQSLRHLVCR